MKKKNETINKADLVLKILAGTLFVLTLVYMFTIWNLGFHSDTASSNVLAREQMRTGQWLPDTWHWSTGLTLLFYNTLIIPLSLFTKNQILLRDMSVCIVLLAFVLLLRYFSKKQIGSAFYLFFLCFFFSNTSPMVMDMAFAQAAYLISLTYSILLLVLFLKAFDENFVIRSRCWLAALMLFVIYLSLSGVLNLAYQLIPLLGAVVLYFILEHWNASFESIQKELSSWIKAIAIILTSVVIGFFGYKGLIAYTGFQTGANIIYPESSELANHFVQFILSAIGYRTNVKLFSLEGLMNAVIIFGFIAVIVCCVLLFIKYQEQPFAVKMLMHFSLLVNAIHLYFIFTNYCLSLNDVRYMFRPMMFLWILAAYYVHTYVLPQGFLLKTVAIAAIAAFSLPYMVSNIPQVMRYPQAREYQMGLVNFLREQDLKHGYATFWNAGKNMVLSDFDIEIGGIHLNKAIEPHYWLSSDTTYDPDAYAGESFLLLTQSENSAYAESYGIQRLGQPQEILNYQDYVIYVYPYNIAKNDFQGVGMQDLELIDALVVTDQTMKSDDGTISLSTGQIIYGPYMTLSAGQYEIDLEFSELEETVLARLTSGAGAVIWVTETLQEKASTVYMTAEENLANFEIVLTTGKSATLSSVKITKVN